MASDTGARPAPDVLLPLVPAEVVLVCADPAREQDPPHAAEAACVANAVSKRRFEFAAGRHAARLALARLGIAEFALLPDAQRVPRWPAGVVGSIAHCDGCCVAGVARSERVSGLGLDVEPATPLDDELHALVAAPDELAACRGAGVDAAKLLFCAKEAFYKCYFPAARHALEFRDVAVELCAPPGGGAPGRFRAVLISRSAPPLPDGARALDGRYLCDGGFLYAAVALAPSSPRDRPDAVEL